jgi:ABC-type branched-subunit amino acid transport system substrate-binding protein
MARRACFASLVVMVVALSACTNGPSPRPANTGTAPTTAPVPSPTGPTPSLAVVADLTPGSSALPYVDGMRMAIDEVNASGGVEGSSLALDLRDDGGDVERATSLIEQELQGESVAILYVGSGSALTPLRGQFEQAGKPVVLLGGDLYTSRGLFRQVFQTTIPWAWQAKVIARYLVLDRKAERVAFAGFGPEARSASAAVREALAYWGGALSDSIVRSAGSSVDAVAGRVHSADAVVVFGPPEDSGAMVSALKRLPRPPRIAGSAALLDLPRDELDAPPGTTACYAYTWAGWAEPIRRVGAFRTRFDGREGHLPAGLEQEGYDAVRTLALALSRARGNLGAGLVSGLERIHKTFSSFPVDLGPDDHTFLPRDQLGLFAVAGPGEQLDPWQEAGTEPWRALMRTFTYDGNRTDVLDRDKRVFFPFWRKDRPAPGYWRSRYGIVTRPSRDALH